MKLGTRRQGWGGVVCLALIASFGPASAADVTQPTDRLNLPPTALTLQLGEATSLTLNEITRVVVAIPEVLDVSVLSANEVLLKAIAAGKTDLIIWDAAGQHPYVVDVVDRGPATLETQLRQVVAQLNLPEVTVQRQDNRVFLIGMVDSDAEWSQLEQLLTSYPGVTNLVTVKPAEAPPAAPPPQLVRLSVQVVELDRNFTEKLGVKWSEGISFTEEPISSVGGKGDAGTTLANSSVTDAVGTRLGHALKLGTLFRTGFTQSVNFLVSKGKARILAEPTLVTASGREATSFMGQQIPVISTTTVGISTGGVTATIEFKDVGVRMTMTPTILEEHDKIATALEAEVSTIDDSRAIKVGTGTGFVDVPGFKTRRAKTDVVTTPGETIVIAGLLQTEDSLSVDQVPGLGSAPVIGRLFRSPTTKQKQTELVLAVTPELASRAEESEERSVVIEQALANVELSALEDPRVRYALQVQDRIAQSLRYPAREHVLAVDGTVKLTLHLLADGSLGRAMVTESSGIEALDAAALNAAQLQAPYPAFPPSIVERELWLELPVIFRPS